MRLTQGHDRRRRWTGALAPHEPRKFTVWLETNEPGGWTTDDNGYTFEFEVDGGSLISTGEYDKPDMASLLVAQALYWAARAKLAEAGLL